MFIDDSNKSIAYTRWGKKPRASHEELILSGNFIIFTTGNTGYLMAGNHGQTAGSTYTCVHSHPDALHGGHGNHNGYLLYPVEARCCSLKYPTYTKGRELVCAIVPKYDEYIHEIKQ